VEAALGLAVSVGLKVSGKLTARARRARIPQRVLSHAGVDRLVNESLMLVQNRKMRREVQRFACRFGEAP
jgi:hypothetical protein